MSHDYTRECRLFDLVVYPLEVKRTEANTDFLVEPFYELKVIESFE
jgi:hypothetical protein